MSGDRRLYLAAAEQMARHGAGLMAETGYSLDVKELRARAPRAFLMLLGCDGENALPAFDDYGRGALLGTIPCNTPTPTPSRPLSGS